MAYDTKGEFKKVGISLESYKVKRFREVLRSKGYETKLGKGVTKDTAMLYVKAVHIDNMAEFQKILLGLQYEFAYRN